MNSKSDVNTYSDLVHISSSKFQLYRGLDNTTDEVVAIKVFPDEPSGWRCYNVEKEILSYVDHPNIIKFWSAMDFAKHPAKGSSCSTITMEYASNGDLGNVLRSKKRKMPEALARTLFLRILDAVGYLHTNKCAHLDLKLENILVDDNYDVKIADFDVSQWIYDEKLIGRGSSCSRAPEVKFGTAKDFIAADIYSLGVILFMLVTCTHPYIEPDEEKDPFSMGNLYENLQRKNEKFWKRHEEYQEEEFSMDFKMLINTMLEEDPNKRPPLKMIRDCEWCQGETLNDLDRHREFHSYLH
jgi:serine/threonine protein kinase